MSMSTETDIRMAFAWASEWWLRDAGFPFWGDGKALKWVTGDTFLD